MIDVKPNTVLGVLKESARFAVPTYQRNFTWGKDEARDLMADLKSSSESTDGEGPFLGTFIFHRSKNDSSVINIVDGQQRLTTISLLLIACRATAEKNSNAEQKGVIQNKLTFVDDAKGTSSGTRLIASSSIKDVFEHIANSEWNGLFPTKLNDRSVKRQVNRIKPVYDFFLNELSSYGTDEITAFLNAVYSAHVVQLDIKEQRDAFAIFERTNARGVELDAADLIKNYLFASDIADDVGDIWNQIIDNSEGSILRMLKYYWVSRKGYVQKSELYDRIRIYGDMVGAKALAGELQEFSRFYKVSRSADSTALSEYLEEINCDRLKNYEYNEHKIQGVLEALRLFKVTQAYPVIFSAFQCYRRSGGCDSQATTKKFLDTLDCIEKYHFINNVICERVGNEIERPYADVAQAFADSDDFNSVADGLIKLLKSKLAKNEEFVPRFADLAYSADSIPLICYIFDRINNHNLKPGQKVRLYNPDKKYIRRNFNIEHFYPRNPDEIEGGQGTMENTDNIGNLLVISFFTNIKLSNLKPVEKIEMLKENIDKIQNLAHVQKFIAEYQNTAKDWNEEMIKERARKIAEAAFTEIWSL